MRVLLVSEGAHEGSGALQHLVRRALPRMTSCEWRQVKDSRLRVHHGKGTRLLKRAVSWIRQARHEGFDALVLVIDHDGDDQRITDLDGAQEEFRITGGMPRALGVAIRSFDAWMLADEAALSQVLGYPVPRQADPEGIRDPKLSYRQLRDRASIELRQRDLYADIASQVDLQRVAERCPQGFAVFISRLQKLAD